MSDKHYFYTDPLAAAWMAKHYGMLFDGLSNNLNDMSDFFFESQTGAVVLSDGPFIIHPDSLHLLEPQVDDAFESYREHPRNGMLIWFGKVTNNLSRLTEQSLMTPEQLKNDPDNEYKIIQRNGMAFMWPEICDDQEMRKRIEEGIRWPSQSEEN